MLKKPNRITFGAIDCVAKASCHVQPLSPLQRRLRLKNSSQEALTGTNIESSNGINGVKKVQALNKVTSTADFLAYFYRALLQ